MNRKQRRAQGQKSDRLDQPAAAPDPAALHEAGIEAFRGGRLAMAADLIGQAIAAGASVPELHYNLAIVLKALRRPLDAAASYERAIALRPDHVNAHNNLGNVWKELGEPDKARASFARALQHNPGNADTHYNLGILCSDQGSFEEAEQHFRRCLACDPNDRRGAGMLLAHLGAGAAPHQTPQAQLLDLYDVRARFWDQEGAYFGAVLVAEAFRRHAPPAPPQARPDILDIGCGTGLVGTQIADLAGGLDGVDISAAMLEKAKAKGVYQRLFAADLVSFMAGRQDSYDAILGAAALIHFGDLRPLFQAASHALRGGGLFIFTVFPHEASADYAVASGARLARSGCFAHGLAYLERLAAEAEFSVLELKKTVHEYDQDNKPVAGVLAVLRRS